MAAFVGRKLAFGAVCAAWPAGGASQPGGTVVGRGLVLPDMDAMQGKMLFVNKRCVTCHSINGVGGTDAPALDAARWPPSMNPFDVAARMWRAAPRMVPAQVDELGAQIEFTGDELADIIAFIHDEKAQKTLSLSDVPPGIRRKIMRDEHGSDERRADTPPQ